MKLAILKVSNIQNAVSNQFPEVNKEVYEASVKLWLGQQRQSLSFQSSKPLETTAL